METALTGMSGFGDRAEEVRKRWAWVEPSVWTERMLTKLENWVKGDKWVGLMDMVCQPRNLQSAFKRVKANHGSAGADGTSIDNYKQCIEQNLGNLSARIMAGRYIPQVVKRIWIPKTGSPGKRALGIPTVEDRVAQTALRNVIAPIFEQDFSSYSYGYRPRRGVKDALKRVEQLLADGLGWVLDADVKSYFDTIPHEGLMELVKTKIGDEGVLFLIQAYLNQEVTDGVRKWKQKTGTPQGGVVSPLLSNIYLNPLDHKMEKLGYEMVRYADDFIVLCRSEGEAQRALEEVRDWMVKAGLQLHPEKTRIVDACKEGFEFLGYHFENGRKWPKKRSLEKQKNAIEKSEVNKTAKVDDFGTVSAKGLGLEAEKRFAGKEVDKSANCLGIW